MSLSLDNITEQVIASVLVFLLTVVLVFICKKYFVLFFKRLKLKFLPVKFNVALSIDSKDGYNSGNYYTEIKNQLNQSIDDNSLRNYIEINDLVDIRKFDNKIEAENFIKNRDLDLVVWGSLGTDNLKKDGKIINDLTLNFTYRHPDDGASKISSMLVLDFKSKFSVKKYWRIVEENSYDDIKVVTNNIFDLSTYILGTTLKFSGKFKESLGLFESLYFKLIRENDPFSEHVKPQLVNCYEIFIAHFGSRKDKNLDGELYCQKYLEVMPNSEFGISNLAFFQFKLGKKEDAKNNVDKLQLLYPNKAVTDADIAFFNILNKNYKEAYRSYEKISQFRLDRLGFNPLYIVESLFDQYELTKESGFLYGAAIFSFYFGDRTLAVESFNQFLSKKLNKNYSRMLSKAKRLAKVSNFKYK